MQNVLCGGIGIKSNKIAVIGCVKMLTHPIFCIIAFVEKFALNKQYIKNANSIDNDGTRLCVFLSAHEAAKCPHGHCLSFEIGCKGTAFF